MMFRLLFSLCFAGILIVSCNYEQKKKESKDVTIEEEIVSEPDTTAKATAIFWVDKNDKRGNKPLKIRAVKANVIIDEDGKVEVISYVKPQPNAIMNYLNKKLEKFRVSKLMIENDYIKPGQQYVQLRYITDNVIL